MEVIYLDRLFLFNLLTDYLLCLVSARVCGLTLRRGRYALAAALGALYAVLSVLPGLAFLRAPPGILAAAALLAAVAFGAERRPFRCGGVFLAVSAAFGGAVWAVSLAGGTRPGAAVSGRVLLLAFALCYAAVSLLFARRAQLPDRARAEVVLREKGRESRFMALRDSGNALCDPMTGMSVMLVSPHVLFPVLPEAAALFSGADPVEALREASRLPGLAGRFRLIPYASVGARGLLPVFRPEGLTVDGREEELLVAVTPSAAGDGFEGVV